MKEINSYLRYIMPGMVFLTAMVIPYVIGKNNDFINSLTSDETNIIISIIGLVAISGVFGFLSSVIYWFLFLSFDLLKIKKTIEDLGDQILILNPKKEIVEINKLKLQERWSIFNTYWYLTKHKEVLESKSERLASLTSSIGTAFISFSISIIIWILVLIIGEIEIEKNLLCVIIFWIFFLYALGNNFNKTLKRFRLFNNSVFSHFIIKEVKKHDKKVEIILSK